MCCGDSAFCYILLRIVRSCSIKESTCLNSNYKLCLPYRVQPLISLLNIFQLPAAAFTALLLGCSPPSWYEVSWKLGMSLYLDPGSCSLWGFLASSWSASPSSVLWYQRHYSFCLYAIWAVHELETHAVKKEANSHIASGAVLAFKNTFLSLHLPALSLSPLESFLHMHSLAIVQRFG